jgi:hypothetical protein
VINYAWCSPLLNVLPAKQRFSEWAMVGSTQRPLPCEGSKAVPNAF